MIQIQWNEAKCCHSGKCVDALPQVFKIVNGKFVIDANAAPRPAIQKVVDDCPTQALTLKQ